MQSRNTGEVIDDLYETNYGPEALAHFKANNPFVIKPEKGPPILRVAGEGDFTIDSLDRMEFVMHLEEQFDIEIDDSEALDLNTRSDLIEFVDGKLAAKR